MHERVLKILIHKKKVRPRHFIIIYKNVVLKIIFNFSFLLQLSLNFAVLDRIGGWKDNAHVFEFQKSCSTSKNLLDRKVWVMVLNSLNVTDYSCPIKEVRLECIVGIKSY